MSNYIVVDGPAYGNILVPVPALTPSKSFINLGGIRGLTKDAAVLGANNLSYATVGTLDVIGQDAVPFVFAVGAPVYVTAAGAFTNVPRSALGIPVITLGVTATTGGTFNAGAEFWKVTAVGADGETLASNEITATLVATGTQVINWTAITGATGYKVYRGTAAGAENTLVATLGAVATYTDTGIAGTAATVPTPVTAIGVATRATNGTSAPVFVALTPGVFTA